MFFLLLGAGVLGGSVRGKRLLLIGLALFGAVSPMAAFAGTSGLVVAARAVLPESRDPAPPRIDVPGAVLSTAGSSSSPAP